MDLGSTRVAQTAVTFSRVGVDDLTRSVPTGPTCNVPLSVARCGEEAQATLEGLSPVLGFQLSTLSTSAPPPVPLSAVAWDAATSEAVFFGGSAGGLGLTWILSHGEWANATAVGTAPPARWGASMAYDAQPGIDTVVLFGGCGATCPLNDTWLYSPSGWREVPSSAPAPPRSFGASMTSWGPNGTVLFGGCLDVTCSAESRATWAFQDNATCEGHYGAPCWVNLTEEAWVRASSPPGLAGAAFAVDPMIGPVNGTAVLYGGRCDSCSESDSNETWLFEGGRWTDATSSYGGLTYPNEGRSYSALFWDPYSQRLYLYGGRNDTTGESYAALYATDVDTWFAASSRLYPQAEYGIAVTTGSPPTQGPTLPPLLVGGNASGNVPQDSTWVFEPSVVASVHVTPTDAETNAPVQFFSNSSGGTDLNRTWSPGDGSILYSGNGTHAYNRSGTYDAQFNVTDLCGVQNLTSVAVQVSPFLLGLTVPETLDVGSIGAFSSHPTNGTRPFNFTWTFSDGTVLYGSSVNHSFGSVGLASVVIGVRDAVDTSVSDRIALAINPALVGVVTAMPGEIDVGATATISAVGVDGSPPYSFAWTLPDGRTSSAANVSYLTTAVGIADFGVTIRDAGAGVWSSNLSLPVNPALTFIASASATNFFSGRSVSFSTSITGGTPPFVFSWHFGDGTTSTSSSPRHSYSASGTFLVNVWVNDSGEGHYHQIVDAKVARTSGGLIWDLAALPLWLQIAVVASTIAVFVILVVLVAHRSQIRKRESWDRAEPASKR